MLSHSSERLRVRLFINLAWLFALPTLLNAQGNASSWTALDSAVKAFVGVNVVPMDRDIVLADQTVIVRDGRIAFVGPHASTAVPGSARRIDGRNKWLMPGLTDAHVHLANV